MASDNTSVPNLPEAQIARRQLHIILMLDCSGSMNGEKIASLNYAIRSAVAELRDVAEENPEVDMRLSAVRFSDEAHWHIETPTKMEDVDWEDLTAQGETSMGQALSLVTELLGGNHFSGRQLPPLILLVTDGYSTDDFHAAYQEFLTNPAAEHATKLAVAIGDAADLETLETYTNKKVTGISPLCARSAPDLVRFIKWATTAPVKATSSPTNSPSQQEELALATSSIQQDNSEIVW